MRCRQQKTVRSRFTHFSLSFNLNVLLFCKLFFSDYNNNTDLHIAVTTSQGVIVEFDRHGLRRHTPKSNKSSWEQSLIVESIPEAWWEYFDEVLSKVWSFLTPQLFLLIGHLTFRHASNPLGSQLLTTRTRIIAIRSF